MRPRNRSLHIKSGVIVLFPPFFRNPVRLQCPSSLQSFGLKLFYLATLSHRLGSSCTWIYFEYLSVNPFSAFTVSVEIMKLYAVDSRRFHFSPMGGEQKLPINLQGGYFHLLLPNNFDFQPGKNNKNCMCDVLRINPLILLSENAML